MSTTWSPSIHWSCSVNGSNEAEASEPNDANGAALATATPDGNPSVRMVLVKRADERGFCFFTNAESKKGIDLQANPRAALCFHWKSLRRQVRVAGRVTEMAGADVDEYFHSRLRTARSAPPFRSRAGRWPAARSWKSNSANSPRTIRERYRDRPTGAVTACKRSRSSSGYRAKTVFTTGTCLSATPVHGRKPAVSVVTWNGCGFEGCGKSLG